MIETVVGLIIGGGIGFILGYIVAVIRETKDEVDEVLKIERKHDELGLLQHRVAFNISFAVMMIFVFYAAFSSFQNARDLSQNQKEDFARVCKAGQEIRQVQRQTVDAVYSLALSIIDRDPNRKRTPEELHNANSFIERANYFRETTYDNIKPTKSCLEYVTDDNVDPPTPPHPHLE